MRFILTTAVMANDYNISRQAIGFLIWLRNHYKDGIQDSYMRMSERYGQCKYGTCRNMLLELESAGYVKIIGKGSHSQAFQIDMDKYNELVNPYTQNNDSRIKVPGEPED